MIAPSLLLLLALALQSTAPHTPSAAPADGPPAFTTAPVTADMVLSSMDHRTLHLRAGAFDEGALTQLGLGARHSVHDGDPIIRGFRHPDNMILLGTIDGRDGADKCTVMAPTGRGLDFSQMRSAIEQQTSVLPTSAGASVRWTLDDMTLELKPMGGAGVIIEVLPRNAATPSR